MRGAPRPGPGGAGTKHGASPFVDCACDPDECDCYVDDEALVKVMLEEWLNGDAVVLVRTNTRPMLNLSLVLCASV